MNSVKLQIRDIGHTPSKKNHHFPGQNGRLLIDAPVKARMKALEDAILLALYSESLTIERETGSGCLKQLRTLLSGLSDDSIREIPACSFSVEKVSKGQEGVDITITELTDVTPTEQKVYETLYPSP